MTHHFIFLANDQNHHELTFGIAAHDEVAHQTFVGAEVVVGQFSVHREPSDKQTDVVGWVGLQVTFFNVDNAVEELW